MKKRGDLFILIALLCLLGFLTQQVATQNARKVEEDPAHPRRTVRSARPGGWRAIYLLLKERGNVRVAAFEKKPSSWTDDTKVMVTGEPYLSFNLSGLSAQWDSQQAKDAFAWVEKGNTLIVLSDSENNALMSELKLTVEDHLHSDAKLAPRQPNPLLQGIRQVTFPGTSRLTKTPGHAVPLFADDKPAAVLIRQGKGNIIVFAGAELIANRNLAKTENARLFVQLIEGSANGGKVAFDEYHQGFDTENKVDFWDAIGPVGQMIFWQIVAVCLLIAYSAGRRFGLPRPAPEPPRISSEYVASLADLYQRARARSAVLESIYLPFWRELCRSVGVPLDTPTEDVVRRAGASLLNTKTPDSRNRLEARLNETLREIEEKIDTQPSKWRDTDLLRLSRELEELRKELGLGRDN